jgi:hypothetical protein
LPALGTTAQLSARVRVLIKGQSEAAAAKEQPAQPLPRVDMTMSSGKSRLSRAIIVEDEILIALALEAEMKDLLSI